jgi:hypothetical protein
VNDKIVKLEYVPTKEQIADIFTKPLPRDTFDYLKKEDGIHSHFSIKYSVESYWELSRTKILGGECIWLHVAKKNEEYVIRGSYRKTRRLLATMKKLPNIETLFH